MSRSFPICVLFALLLSVSGCSDDTTNNYATPANSIYGRVQPATPETEIAAWQAEKMASTIADEEGYFALTDLAPGLYRIEATSPSGYHGERQDVSIGPSAGVSIGTLVLTDAPGILEYYNPPRTADPLFGATAAVNLRFSEPMDVASFGSAVIFEPAIEGQWQASAGNSYGFRSEHPFRAGRTYEVTINPDLRTRAGEPWGESFSFPLTIRPFAVINFEQYGDPFRLSPGDAGTIGVLTFSMPTELESVSEGVVSDPPMDLTVIPGYSDQQTTRFELRRLAGLPSGTAFRITIGPNLLDVNGDPLSEPFILNVRTEDFRQVSRYQEANLTALPPNFTGGLFTEQYNTSVDLASARQAISVLPAAELMVEQDSGFNEKKYLRVRVIEPLRPGTHYVLRFDPSLAATDGATIGHERLVEFTTLPLEVVGATIRGVNRYTDANEVDPGTLVETEIEFNAPIDLPSLIAAAEFQPPMAGYWLANGYSDRRYRFFPAETVPVAPGGTGQLIVHGGVPLAGSVGLEEDFVATYEVLPVMVTSGSPNSGSTVYRYDPVRLRFNAAMNRAEVQGAFSLATASGTPVTGTFTWTDGDTDVEFRPTNALPPQTVFEARLEKTGVHSANGYELASTWQSYFRVNSY